MSKVQIEINQQSVKLSGLWHAETLRETLSATRRQLELAPRDAHWDLSAVSQLDRVSANVLLTHWQGQLPDQLTISDRHLDILKETRAVEPPERSSTQPPALESTWNGLPEFLGHFTHTLGAVLFGRIRFPKTEVVRELDHLVVSALTVVALISTLAGIAVGYLFSQLLLKYGGSGYVIDALGLATARDLAPLAAALLLAGRSGSAIATELGTMRITQELDALQTMSIDVWSRVVLPKTIALTLGLPALTLWSAIFTMLGGVWICSLELPLTFTQMIGSLPGKLPLTNLFLGLGKAIVFGIGIGVLASYFGYTCQPNTQSMARKTTNSVVVCIAFVLLGNAYLDIISRTVGLK